MNDIESKTELPLVAVSTKTKLKKTLKKAKTVTKTKTKNKIIPVKKNTVKVVLSKIILDKLSMKTTAFISMLKSKRVASEVATRSGLSKNTILNLRKKFNIEVK